MPEFVKIELTPEDAEMFLQFQKHYALIKLLDEKGVFKIKDGSVTLHFNKYGVIVGLSKKEEFSVQ